MFLSSVFFPIDSVPRGARWVVELNPLAIIIDEARGSFMYGQWPELRLLASVLLLSLVIAVLGYAAFMRLKPGFADVV
jgi:lipopolysaccharide transport system permease protein